MGLALSNWASKPVNLLSREPVNSYRGLRHGQQKKGLTLHSKNKGSISRDEREHIARVKGLPCAVCEHPAPSECHELEQGLWFVSIPLCADCHRGSFNGLHGQRRIWQTFKITELIALNRTIKTLLSGRV